MAVERAELELVWPPALFAGVGEGLFDEGDCDDAALELLLAEAFHDELGVKLLGEHRRRDRARTEAGPSFGPRRYDEPPPPETMQLVAELIQGAGQLPRYQPRRYYAARHHPKPAPAPLTLAQTKRTFAEEVAQLAGRGYFDDAFGSSCVDSRDHPDRDGERRLMGLLDTDQPLWPLRRGNVDEGVERDWSDELFFSLVEALHDLMARPQRRTWHDFADEWDYADFSRSAGRAVYRWRVNELLDRSEVALRLAESGSDVGLLVHAAGDPRDDLVDRALVTPAVGDRAEVEHAIGLFRSRSGTREDKRSAAVALARVLEHRRDLIKAAFLSKDEGALFDIANRYDLRHRDARQHADYDDFYLDWVFWWYLATVELTDRLLARQAAAGG